MFVVAIPSYRRANAISNKTLATLAIGGVPVSDIYIFVVADEQADYERACPEYKVVVGQLGLVAQRKFIQDYFPINTNIVMMDDDITEIYTPINLLCREILTDLPETFEYMIRCMESEKVSICGIYPVDNLRFSLGNQSISLDFKYIVGALYLIKNTRDIVLEYGDALEDRERSVLYYLKEHKTMRFNRICIKTKYFAPGGMFNSERLRKHSEVAQELVARYPEFLRLKDTKRCLDAKCRKIRAVPTQVV